LKPNHAIAEKAGVALPGFRLVLVRPKFAGNIGACARLAANFGVSDIWLVAPECPPDWKSSEQVQAFATGSSSQTLVEFQETQSLREALAPCTRAIAFTRRPRDRFPLDVLFSEAFLPPGEPPNQPHHIRWPEDPIKIALVFGNEKTGLTDIEIQECQQCVRIATSAELGSMNLSHAVAVVLSRLFEWAERGHKTLAPHRINDARDSTDLPATLEDLQGLWQHWEEALVTLGFTQAGNPKRILESLKDALRTVPWRQQQVNLFRGILRRIIHAHSDRA
jgi:tRNA/rRNA methyltransferase